MIILGIESSCDETAAAIVKDGTHTFANVIASSAEMHVASGGIIPEVAARQQTKSILPVIKQALDQASLKLSAIDSLAVAYGPGLIGSLLVGVETAKTLSIVADKPLIAVNHLLGHIYAAWLNPQRQPQFPLLALVVSGGHSDLVYIKGHNEIKWLGGTRDDAAGEAFDKTARLLGLGYPGGPAISQAADNYLKNNPDKELNIFPRPMISSDNYDFSFSGLKTAVYNYLKTHPVIARSDSDEAISSLAANIQEAICDVLITKSLKAIEQYKVINFILCGGVAANNRLRVKFTQRLSENIRFFVPEIKYCTDNAAMITAAAYFNQDYVSPLELNANPQLTITD